MKQNEKKKVQAEGSTECLVGKAIHLRGEQIGDLKSPESKRTAIRLLH